MSKNPGLLAGPTAARFKSAVTHADRSVAALLALWILTMISLPIVRWTLGASAMQSGVVVGVLIQVVVVLVILSRSWGWTRTLTTSMVVVAAAWMAEAVGSTTGIPFGSYSYTAALQPQLAHVPVLIPLAWLMMLPPAWAVAKAITGQSHGPAFVIVSALAFTAWDLFLDPQMVSWGFWIWQQPQGYFGIPWTNFAGWLMVSAAITWLARPRDLPITPLVLVYAITWALETIGQLFFWNLPGPAMIGFVAMGSLLAGALASTKRRQHAQLSGV